MSTNNIQPLGYRVLVKRAKVSASKGGILLPETAQKKPTEGEVIAVGPGIVDEAGHFKKPEVVVGDSVMFNGYAGSVVKTEDDQTEYLILSVDDLLGVLVESAN